MSRIAISGVISQTRNIKIVKDEGDDAFITTWDIPEGDFLFTYPTAPYTGGVYDYWLDWGDGSEIEHFIDDTPPTHEYEKEGEYQISARGSLPRFGFGYIIDDYVEVLGEPSLLLGVDNFGDVGFRSMEFMFYSTGNIYLPKQLPINNLVTNFEYMFNDSEFNQDISDWDMSKAEIVRHMFGSCPNFNQNISNWNMCSVVDMLGMFSWTTAFNQDIGGWDVSKVTDMSVMFFFATAFNQDLSNWCVSQIPSKPVYFDTGATAWVLPRPNWGAPCN